MEIRTGCARKQIFVDFLTDSWPFELLFDNDSHTDVTVNVIILSCKKEFPKLEVQLYHINDFFYKMQKYEQLTIYLIRLESVGEK